MASGRTIFHVDMDAFFASIEQRDTPAYRGKPVIVGAAPGQRGVVSAASYEARKFGVHSALPISEAVRRCPNGVFVRPRMDVYAAESDIIMEILRSFSPLVEQISVDEAFVDMTGTEKLWGSALACARKVSATISAKTGLSASIGIAPNKFLAKIASDMKKPRGITVVPIDQAAIEAWLAPLPIRKIWGIGKKTEEFLGRYGVKIVADAQAFEREYLLGLLGRGGLDLYELCRGLDDRPVAEGDGAKSISHEHTFGSDTADTNVLAQTLLGLSHEVAVRARRSGVKGDTVVLCWRYPDFSRHSRRSRLSAGTSNGREIYDTAMRLFRDYPLTGKPLRLIGVGITGLGAEYQTSLFEETAGGVRQERTERAADVIRERFGDETIFFGGEKSVKDARRTRHRQ